MGVGNCEPNKARAITLAVTHMDDILAEMHGATLFATIDFVSSSAEESHNIAEFITHEGLFRFCMDFVQPQEHSTCPWC